jgi:hypothetical protein
MNGRLLIVACIVSAAISRADAGIYSGPTDTAHPIDPAIPGSSSQFVEWAGAIDASRTYFAPRGNTTISATGVNSLGDLDASQIANGDSPGYITVTFPHGIRDQLGADFAVFENGFTFGSPNGLFAELAYVEVSSNGIDFARFPSISTNTGPVQGSPPFAGYDMSNVYNLAGKHAANFGTPFDLSELLTNSLVIGGNVDLANIQYVKLVDIPGSGAFHDSAGNPILDNWLTSASTAGYDFRLGTSNGVGVIHAVPEPATLTTAIIVLVPILTLRRPRRTPIRD